MKEERNRVYIRSCKMVLWPIRARVLFELFYNSYPNIARVKLRIKYECFFSSTDNYCAFADLQYNGIRLGSPKCVIIYKMERKSIANFLKIQNHELFKTYSCK